MNSPSHLLFEKEYGQAKTRLFLNRQDLLSKLLTDEGSKYYTGPANPIEFAKESNRLQTYLSHLLSGTGKRKIVSALEDSLLHLISQKLEHEDVNYRAITDEITASISALNNVEEQKEDDTFREFLNTQNESSYIAVFTSQPLELEANPNQQLKQIRTSLINAILNHRSNTTFTDRPINKYRYNFPDKITCILFWRKLSLLVMKRILNQSMELEFKECIDKLQITYQEHENYKIALKYQVDAYLSYCNSKTWIQVFQMDEPVFVLPYIVFNPNEISKAKGYIIRYIDSSIELQKWTITEYQMWHRYVWNVLKQRSQSNPIKYADSIEKNIVNLDLDNL